MTDKMYLRKRDLVDELGMARGTVSDWINEFSMFMPTVKHGNVTYYKPEALDVLRAIKEIKEQGFLFKPDILPVLLNRGYAITVQEVIDDVQKAFNQPDTRDGMVKVVTELHRQNEALEQLEECTHGLVGQIEEQAERMDGQDGRIKSVEEKQNIVAGEVAVLLRRIAEAEERAARAEVAAAKAQEQANKSIWRKFFGG